jgi:hypothetical protein
MNQSGMLKITHKARVKFSIGNYIDMVDCDVAAMSAGHLLLGRPRQYDLDATHSGRSNHYSFVHKGVSHVLKPMKESVIKVEVFATIKRRTPTETIPKLRRTLFQGEENDVAIVGDDLNANCNNKVAETMSDLIDISAKPRAALIQGRENDEPINHQVHSTMYVEDFDNISVAKSKKKILLGANLCNNENKIDITSCIMIGLILLEIKEPKDHVGSPRLSMGAGYLPFKFYMVSSPPNKEISRYGKSKSSSCPTQNPGAVHIKTDARVTYDIKVGHSWTLWEEKDLIFPTGLVSYPTKT